MDLKMKMDLDAIRDRQEIIEEIYQELEELLLGNRKGATTYLQQTYYLGENAQQSFRESGKGRTHKEREFNYLPRTVQDWNMLSSEEMAKMRGSLLEELEKMKLRLISGVSELNQIILENRCN